MSGDLTQFQIPTDVLWCSRCNRPVDRVEYETPIETIRAYGMMPQMIHTGEVIVTVHCHGEVWRASYWTESPGYTATSR